MPQLEPKEAQIKEFWEWCGIKFEERLLHDRQSGAEFAGADWLRSRCIYPDGRKETGYPLLDLNNLFEYAVPVAINKFIEQSKRIAPPLAISEQTAFRELIAEWLAKNPIQFGFENTLFWVIQKIISADKTVELGNNLKNSKRYGAIARERLK